VHEYPHQKQQNQFGVGSIPETSSDVLFLCVSREKQVINNKFDRPVPEINKVHTHFLESPLAMMFICC
jgi:hypothetical protein